MSYSCACDTQYQALWTIHTGIGNAARKTESHRDCGSPDSLDLWQDILTPQVEDQALDAFKSNWDCRLQRQSAEEQLNSKQEVCSIHPWDTHYERPRGSSLGGRMPVHLYIYFLGRMNLCTERQCCFCPKMVLVKGRH